MRQDIKIKKLKDVILFTDSNGIEYIRLSSNVWHVFNEDTKLLYLHSEFEREYQKILKYEKVEAKAKLDNISKKAIRRFAWEARDKSSKVSKKSGRKK